VHTCPERAVGAGSGEGDEELDLLGRDESGGVRGAANSTI
jgi:hypothetical protein